MGSKFDLLCAEMRYRKKYIPHHAQLQIINILYTQKHMSGKDKNNVLGIKFKYAEVFESMKVQLKRINNIEKTVKIKNMVLRTT
jgi:hypothetical protein